MFRGIICCISVLLEQFLNDRMRKPSPGNGLGFSHGQNQLQFSGKEMKRREKPLGRHRLHLEKQGFDPHRDSGYVRHVILRKGSRVDGAGYGPNL